MYNPQQPYQQDPNSSPDSRAQKINARWKALSALYILAAFGIVMYWEFTDSGLCIMVREWQGMILDDSYYPALDILLALLMFLVPLFLVKIIVEKVTGVKIEGFRK